MEELPAYLKGVAKVPPVAVSWFDFAVTRES
jgi:hypothetical protein